MSNQRHSSVSSSVSFARIVSGDSGNSKQVETDEKQKEQTKNSESLNGTEDWPTLDGATLEENTFSKSMNGKTNKNTDRKQKVDTIPDNGDLTQVPEILSPNVGFRKVTKNSWKKVEIDVDYNTREITKKRQMEWREERRAREAAFRRKNFVGRGPRRGAVPSDGNRNKIGRHHNEHKEEMSEKPSDWDEKSLQTEDRETSSEMRQVEQAQEQQQQNYWYFDGTSNGYYYQHSGSQGWKKNRRRPTNGPKHFHPRVSTQHNEQCVSAADGLSEQLFCKVQIVLQTFAAPTLCPFAHRLSPALPPDTVVVATTDQLASSTSAAHFTPTVLTAQFPPNALFAAHPLAATPYIDEMKLKDLVRAQIEYYFSADNLQKDFFLRRKMDHEGFLPLNLVASFPRVRSLTLDQNFIVSSLCNSEKVELNEDHQKIRPRINPQQWPLLESATHTEADDSPAMMTATGPTAEAIEDTEQTSEKRPSAGKDGSAPAQQQPILPSQSHTEDTLEKSQKGEETKKGVGKESNSSGPTVVCQESGHVTDATSSSSSSGSVTETPKGEHQQQQQQKQDDQEEGWKQVRSKRNKRGNPLFDSFIC